MGLCTAVNTILSLFMSNNWKAEPWRCSVTCIQQGNGVVVWVVVRMLQAQVGSPGDSVGDSCDHNLEKDKLYGP